MIKKYNSFWFFLLAIWAICCNGTQEVIPQQTELQLAKLLETVRIDVEKIKKVDIQNALINNEQANRLMGNGQAVEFVNVCKKLLDTYRGYAKNRRKKTTDLPTKNFLELIAKSNELLTIFLVGKSNQKDLLLPYRFVLSKIDDPTIADPLAKISQDTLDEIRRNYQFLKGLKALAPHLIKRLEPLGVALG